MSRRDPNGFTLVELMVTVALIGIVGLLSAPALFSQIPKRRVDGAARALGAEMNLVRMKAITANKPHEARFDPSGQTITIYRLATTSSLLKTIAFSSAFPNVSLDYNSVTGVDGSAVSSATSFSSARARFLPNGMLAEGGVFYVMPAVDKSRRNDRLRAVQVSRAGQVKLWRFDAANSPPWEEF